MNAADFVSEFLARYPKRDGETEAARELFRKDIFDVVEAVGDGNVAELDRRVKQEWNKQGRPPLGFLWQVAREIRPAAGAKHDGSQYGYRCRECRAILSRNVACPFCRDDTGNDVVVLGPDARVEGVTPDCYRCTLFEHGKRRYGPECDRWGHHDAGDLCRDCICSPCCSMEKRWRSDYGKMAGATREGRLGTDHYSWLEAGRGGSASSSTPAPSGPPSRS